MHHDNNIKSIPSNIDKINNHLAWSFCACQSILSFPCAFHLQNCRSIDAACKIRMQNAGYGMQYSNVRGRCWIRLMNVWTSQIEGRDDLDAQEEIDQVNVCPLRNWTMPWDESMRYERNSSMWVVHVTLSKGIECDTSQVNVGSKGVVIYSLHPSYMRSIACNWPW